MNTLVVRNAYSVIHQALASLVPPCEAIEKEDFHYEIWAVKKERFLVASLTRHDHSVTLEFSNHIPKEAMRSIFSEYMLLKMNDHRRLEIHQITSELSNDIREAIQALVRYYQDNDWI